MTETRTPTLTATTFVARADAILPEKVVLDEMISDVLTNWKGTGGIDWVMVDSHRVADAFITRRARLGLSPDRKQTTDYVQHMFREARHVCRHADGSSYRLHPGETCGETCTRKYLHAASADRRPPCPDCFTETTTQGTCPLGCDEF